MSLAFSHSDSELLRAYYAQDDESAFRELVERYQSMVMAAALRRLGDVETARDVAQEVFAALARKARSLADRVSLGGWLHQAAMLESVRALRSDLRRQKRHVALALEETEVDVVTPAVTPAFAILDEAMSGLAEGDREVLVLRYFQDLSYEEIAALMDLKEPTVRQRVSRAVERLGQRVQELGGSGNVIRLLLAGAAIQAAVAPQTGLAAAALASSATAAATGPAVIAGATFWKQAAAVAVLAAVGTLYFSGDDPLQERKLVTASNPASAPIETIAGKEGAAGTVAPTAARPSPSSPLAVAQPAAERSVAEEAVSENVGAPAIPRGPAPVASYRLAFPSASREVADVSPSPSRSSSSEENRSTRERGTALADASPARTLVRIPRPVQVDGVTPPLVELEAVVDELGALEETPAEAAQVYTDLLDEVLSLSLVERLQVEQILQGHFSDLLGEGLIAPLLEETLDPVALLLRDLHIDETVAQIAGGLGDLTAPLEPVKDVLKAGGGLKPVEDLLEVLPTALAPVKETPVVGPLLDALIPQPSAGSEGNKTAGGGTPAANPPKKGLGGLLGPLLGR